MVREPIRLLCVIFIINPIEIGRIGEYHNMCVIKGIKAYFMVWARQTSIHIFHRFFCMLRFWLLLFVSNVCPCVCVLTKKKLVDWFGDIVPCHDIGKGLSYQQFAASGITRAHFVNVVQRAKNVRYINIKEYETTQSNTRQALLVLTRSKMFSLHEHKEIHGTVGSKS